MAAQTKLQKLADELEQTLDRREEIEAQLAPIKEYEEQIRTKLLAELKAKGYKFVKTTSGLGFGITLGKTTFAIKEGAEKDALEWARKEYPSILSINKPLLAKVLKPLLTLPPYFEERVGESHLSVRGAEEM